MNFYYVKSGGTAAGDVNFNTKQVGAWSVDTTQYYDNIYDCLTQSSMLSGDVVVVSNLHNHVYVAQVTYDFGASIVIISVDDANRDIELLGASEHTGVNKIYFSSNGSQAVTLINMLFTATDFVYVADLYLKLKLINSEINISGVSRLQVQSGSTLMMHKSILTAPYLSLYSGAHIVLDDISWLGSVPNFMIYATDRMSLITIRNTDISSIITPTVPILRSASGNVLTMHNCKIGVNQAILYASPNPSTKVDLYSCDSGNGYHYFYSWRYEGEVSESTLVYLNYSYDGVNKASALMNSSNFANIGSPLSYKLCEIPAQDLAVTDKTYRVNLLLDTDTVPTLNNSEFFVELTHSDNNSLALGETVSSRNVNILASNTELIESSELWGGTLPSNVKAYRVDITLSAINLANVTNDNIIVHVNLAVPNADVYVDPVVQIGT